MVLTVYGMVLTPVVVLVLQLVFLLFVRFGFDVASKSEMCSGGRVYGGGSGGWVLEAGCRWGVLGALAGKILPGGDDRWVLKAKVKATGHAVSGLGRH